MAEVRFSLLFLVGVLPLVAQPFSMFPLRHLASLGHLEAGARPTPVGPHITATALAASDTVRLDGRDRDGHPWQVSLRTIGGLGWTEAFTADFDANGQPDLLIGSSFPGNGTCVNHAFIALLLFDPQGRPIPWMLETEVPSVETRPPFVPILVVDANRDGLAEFVTTRCRPGAITGVYEARASNLTLVTKHLAAYRQSAGGLPAYPAQWKPHWFRPVGRTRGFLEGLQSAEFGCQVFPPNPDVRAPGDPCDKSAGAQSVISGQIVAGWPEAIIFDGSSGREIDLLGNYSSIRRVMEQGYRVRPVGGNWFWADTDAPTRPARVTVDLVVAASRRRTLPVVASGNCQDLDYFQPSTNLHLTERRCSPLGSWIRQGDGAVRASLPDGRTVRRSYAAMQHTVSTELTYQPPPNAGRLFGLADVADLTFVDWTTGFALHDEQGSLLASPVYVPFSARLLFEADALVFHPLDAPPGELLEVRGRLRWRAIP